MPEIKKYVKDLDDWREDKEREEQEELDDELEEAPLEDVDAEGELSEEEPDEQEAESEESEEPVEPAEIEDEFDEVDDKLDNLDDKIEDLDDKIDNITIPGQKKAAADTPPEETPARDRTLVTFYIGTSTEKWQDTWSKPVTELTPGRATNAYKKLQDAKDASNDGTVVRIERCNVDAIMAFIEKEYKSDDDWTYVEDYTIDEKTMLYDNYQMFLIDLYQYRKLIKTSKV